MSTSPLPILTLIETRVLGVLCEKQRTVPDTYPLTLNSLLAGCNQKTSRDPVLDLDESDVAAAIDTLKRMAFVIESSGGRAARYAHNTERVLQIPTQSTALLTALMLRGPQTAGELRLNCDRLHKFSDISTVEAFLSELAERAAGPLVVELPRQPGSRENRWAHLLSGEPAAELFHTPIPAIRAGAVGGDDIEELNVRISRLEAELSDLKGVVGKLCSELGISSN